MTTISRRPRARASFLGNPRSSAEIRGRNHRVLRAFRAELAAKDHEFFDCYLDRLELHFQVSIREVSCAFRSAETRDRQVRPVRTIFFRETFRSALVFKSLLQSS